MITTRKKRNVVLMGALFIFLNLWIPVQKTRGFQFQSLPPRRRRNAVVDVRTTRSHVKTKLRVHPDWMQNNMMTPSPLSPTSLILGLASEKDMTSFYKSIGIVVALGGGLIPATIAGNRAMIDTLLGSRRKEEEELPQDFDPRDSLDPTLTEREYRKYVDDSGASGPMLPRSQLLFSKEDIPLADVIAVVGRIKDVNSICDWRKLPSALRPGTSTTNPPMWLPRSAFKVFVRKSKWIGWPTVPGTAGEPVGGAELKSAEERRIRSPDASIGDAALDAVWDSWAGGSGIATPDKVERQLGIWRVDDTFDLNKFTSAAVGGRSQTGLAALTFVALQLLTYTVLFVAPTLRILLDIDIGFGVLGDCDPDRCVNLFQ